MKMNLHNSFTARINIPNQFEKKKSCETEDTRYQLVSKHIMESNTPVHSDDRDHI